MKYVVLKTADFTNWLAELKNRQACLRILTRINAAEDGNFGDHKILPGTGGLSEMRINCGPGYRVYYGRIERKIYLLISGGDKTTQDADISRAKVAWKRIKEEGYADGKD
jgi:putative addiction module killer protein